MLEVALRENLWTTHMGKRDNPNQKNSGEITKWPKRFGGAHVRDGVEVLAEGTDGVPVRHDQCEPLLPTPQRVHQPTKCLNMCSAHCWCLWYDFDAANQNTNNCPIRKYCYSSLKIYKIKIIIHIWSKTLCYDSISETFRFDFVLF